MTSYERIKAMSMEEMVDLAFNWYEKWLNSEVMDKYYVDGKTDMDWDNPQDRIALVKDCGFICGIDTFCPEECKQCPAKECCNEYIEHIESWGDRK